MSLGKKIILISTLTLSLSGLGTAMAQSSCGLGRDDIQNSSILDKQPISVLERCYSENVCEKLESPPESCNTKLGNAYFNKLIQQIPQPTEATQGTPQAPAGAAIKTLPQIPSSDIDAKRTKPAQAMVALAFSENVNLTRRLLCNSKNPSL